MIESSPPAAGAGADMAGGGSDSPGVLWLWAVEAGWEGLLGTSMSRVGGAGLGGPVATLSLLKKSSRLSVISVNEGRS